MSDTSPPDFHKAFGLSGTVPAEQQAPPQPRRIALDLRESAKLTEKLLGLDIAANRLLAQLREIGLSEGDEFFDWTESVMRRAERTLEGSDPVLLQECFATVPGNVELPALDDLE